eukprot:8754104-Alexandrium_andersonii.AAC.1
MLDVAALECFTRLPEPIATCCAHGAMRAKRRDYICVTPFLASCITRVWSGGFGEFDVHAPLYVSFRNRERGRVRELVRPQAFECPESCTRKQWAQKLD